jgi:hypothetical protein
LFLLDPLYFLLNPSQLLLFCRSFVLFGFLVPVLYLDLVELSIALNILYWRGSPPLVWVELVPPPCWLDPTTVADITTGWCS